MKITNNLNLPTPFINAVESEYKYTDKRYSVTSIIKGVREAILLRRHNDEIVQDASEMIWLIFGTAVHSILENGEELRNKYQDKFKEFFDKCDVFVDKNCKHLNEIIKTKTIEL